MRKTRVLLCALLSCVPVAAFAGIGRGTPVPTLGEIGLVLLGASLVGAGVVALGRRTR
jgi:hypothetical protein